MRETERATMSFKYCTILVVAVCMEGVISLLDTSDLCPEFTATFVGLIDQTLEGPNVLEDDPELTYFRDVLGFRDEAIEHTFDDAIRFFNRTYGLDFTLNQPTSHHEYYLENARLSPFRFVEEIRYHLVHSSWSLTGSTRLTCREIHDGGLRVTFSGMQLLHGSYGGETGISADEDNYLFYGFSKIDVCDQSPVIIQMQSPTPFRREPIDGARPFSFDIYNNVLGHGRAVGSYTISPDRADPEKRRFVGRNVFTFPAY